MPTPTAAAAARLLNPATFDASDFDAATRRVFRATIDWFEAKRKTAITSEVYKNGASTISSEFPSGSRT